MVDFGGWYMPVSYTNVIEEHLATRGKAGLFDICHMGEIKIKGKKSQDLVQQLVTRNIDSMPVGRVYLSVICNEKGGIIDDLTIYKIAEDEYMLVTNAGTKDKDFGQVLKVKKQLGLTDSEVKVTDISNKIAKFDLQGPNSQLILKKICSADLNSLKFYSFIKTRILNIKTIISRSGYTGELGYELYFNAKEAVRVWNKLLNIGKRWGLKPIGLGARDTLRLECGMNLYGHEISEEFHPLQSRYGWVVSFDKEFVGKKALEKIKVKGWEKQLVGIEMVDRGIARNCHQIFKNSQRVGWVTSGTYSPTFKKAIGMAYIDKKYDKLGTKLKIKIRDNLIEAKIVKLPFYKRS
jgi:aminomethyltransferase